MRNLAALLLIFTFNTWAQQPGAKPRPAPNRVCR